LLPVSSISWQQSHSIPVKHASNAHGVDKIKKQAKPDMTNKSSSSPLESADQKYGRARWGAAIVAVLVDV
jgi:hypothetical protein